MPYMKMFSKIVRFRYQRCLILERIAAFGGGDWGIAGEYLNYYF
jgi:hypothetical protein